VAVGSRLTVRVTRKGFVGRAIQFKIRPNLIPNRKDLCVAPGTSKLRPC